MSFNDFMSKVRYWDNRLAKWMTRHFYILFFEIFLVLIFWGFFAIIIKTIDAGLDASHGTLIERLLSVQAFANLIIILLLFLNSFWMLYVFNAILRIKSLLKEVAFHLSRKSNPH